MSPEQGTDAWLQSRVGLITGSRVYDVIKGSRLAGWKNYKAQLLVERLTGQPTESFTSKPMQWGTDTEPLARLRYQLITRSAVEETGFIKDAERDFGASPDGLVGKDGLVEIKCPNTAQAFETLKTGKIPPQYIAQMQAQMYVTERQWCDYCSFDPRLPAHASIYIKRVERDDDYIAEMLLAVDTFIEELESDILFISNYGKEVKTITKKESK